MTDGSKTIQHCFSISTSEANKQYTFLSSFTQVPNCLLCGSFLDYVHETNFWMSSGGTRSVIHYDADHNLHCLVAGRKDFIMIERKHYKDLYFIEKVNNLPINFWH